MARKAIDLTGQTFGRLRVLRRAGTYRSKRNYTVVQWRCLFDPELGGCGRETVVLVSNLRNGNTKSCGCLHREWQASRKTNKNGFPRGASALAMTGMEE